MSYTVLARKFRSQTFDEVVGQEAVTTTLKNAITQGRVHHGYLFCGTRGVGKTSMARILAKALNCLEADGATVSPCGRCEACVNIARGEDMDVIEIDAASNTSVDDIRELRGNAIYRPTRCRFKIYIIDEVHMLSKSAFNALLKTLEEPPDHVKFIFATTEVQKVPATILSRVQKFDFSSLSADEIADQLLKICKAEEVDIEDPAARRLARLANGSMRDALSLLDQVLSMADGKLTSTIVDELFPAAHDELFAELIDRFSEGDAAGALDLVDRSLSRGATPDHWCGLLIDQIRDLMVLRVCGGESELVDVPSSLRPKLVEQSQKFDGSTFVYMISVLEELRRIVKNSGSSRALIETAVVRLSEASNFSSIESLLAQVQGGGTAGGRTTPPVDSRSRPAATVKKNNPPQVRKRSDSINASPQPKPVIRAASTRKPSDTVPKVPSPARRTTQADLKAAQDDPDVKAALDLFGGQIVEVVRATPGNPRPIQTDNQP